jgi:VacB/RNase II family 3'-5' exoribonuclease
MLERGLAPDFSDAALAQATAMIPAPAGAGSELRDLRELRWASIDNDDSLDLDQLSVSAPAPGGGVTILVAIADVDAFVKAGSAIDAHARANTTSVYTAAEIFPMLPTRLSTDLTSLGEGQERLAIVVSMTIGADGTLSASEIYRARVLNHAKLAYDSVAAWLEEKAPPPAKVAASPALAEQLRIQDRVAQLMRGRRQQLGALTLQTAEPRAVFDGDVLADLKAEEKNRAKELIEDFMIGANGVTARFLESKGFPSLRRVLRSPERWERIVALAATMNEHLPDEASAPSLDAFLRRRRQADPQRFADLSLAVVKLLGRGEYEPQWPGHGTEGHFGLAVKDYTHSTAPNRRFPDLMAQRLLKAALAGQPIPYGTDELTEMARHCTQQEDNATKVERQVTKSAAALLLGSRIGERFDALVTGVSAKGTWVRIFTPPVEGKLVHGFEGLDVGDRVAVKLTRTDVERGFIDFVRDVP